MVKVDKKDTDIKRNQKKEKNEGWHYEFANKKIKSWPSWKKEIYEANYATCKK